MFRAHFRGDGDAPGGVHAAAERGQDANAAVAQIVAANFDDDVLVAGNLLGGEFLVFEILQQISGRVGVKAVLFGELGKSHRPRQGEQFAGHFSNLFAKFGGATRSIAMPEWHFPGLPRRGRYQHAVVGNIFDSPGARAENDRVAGSAFENHFFIEFADARAFGRPSQKNAIQATIRNGATVDYRDPSRSLAAGELVAYAIPG